MIIKPHYARDIFESLVTDVEISDCVRIISTIFLDTPLKAFRGRNTRFCASTDHFNVIYLAALFSTSVLETIIRDYYDASEQRTIDTDEIKDKVWALIATLPGTRLRMLDLRRDACSILGFPTDTVHAKDQSVGWAVGRHIYYQHEDVDGIIFSSRFDGEDVYVIFDRAIGKLHVTKEGSLMGHSDLAPTLSRYRVRIVSLLGNDRMMGEGAPE